MWWRLRSCVIMDWSSRTAKIISHTHTTASGDGWLSGDRSSVIEHWRLKQQGVPTQD